MSNIYPAGDSPITPNLGLSLVGMDEVVAADMILIDTAFGSGGTSVEVNGSVVNSPNFNGTTPAAPAGHSNVVWQVSGSNVSAYVNTASSAWATLSGDLTETQVIPWDGAVVGTPDTGISRIAGGTLAIGNGSTGDTSGTLTLQHLVSSLTIIDPFLSTVTPSVSINGVGNNPLMLLGTTIQNDGFSILWLGPPAGSPTSTNYVLFSDWSDGGINFADTTLNTVASGNINLSIAGVVALEVGARTGGSCIIHGNLPAFGFGLFSSFARAYISNPSGSLFYIGNVPGDFSGSIKLGTAILTSTTPLQFSSGASAIDTGISRLGAASLAVGNGTAGDFSGSLKTTIVNAVTGIQINGAATSGNVLRGNGTNFVSAQLQYADISGTTPTPPSGAVLWSALGNASANLTLSNANYTTEFDQTSNVAWLWKNTTTATGSTTNASPLLEVAANYWTGSASAADTWTISSSLAAGTNGASTLTIGHTGSTGVAAVSVPSLITSTSPMFNVKAYGATGDGSTDDSTAVIAAITAANTAGGGIVFFPEGTYKILSQITFPNDGASPIPNQSPIRLLGVGCNMNGAASGQGGTTLVPVGGSILDLRYTGTVAKIQTLGSGFLEITGLSLVDFSSSSNTAAFLLTTNTSISVHENTFYGSKKATNSVSATNDAIIFGGTGTGASNGSVTDCFQGYGTVVKGNFFNRVKRAALFQNYANAISFINNTVWDESGYITGGAIELSGNAVDNTTGNYIAGNCIEVTNYLYGIRLVANTYANTFFGNECYDPIGLTTACIRIESNNNLYNTFVTGYGYSLTGVSDASGSTTNVVVDAESGIIKTPVVNAVTGFQVNGAAASGNYLRGNGTDFVSSAIQAGDVLWSGLSGSVLTNQVVPFAPLSVTYGFTTVENPLSDGGNFTAISGTALPKVVSPGVCEPALSTSTNYGAYYSGNWGNDQSSSITLATLAGGSYANLAVRVNGTSRYEVDIQQGASTVYLYAIVSGSAHQIATASVTAPLAGDVWTLSIVGNTLTVTQNGVGKLTFTDSVYNGSLTTGSPGFLLFGVGAITNSQISSWSGNTIGSADSGISHLGAASLAIGNGAAGDFSGSLKLTTLTLQGKIGTYNGVATVNQGVAPILAAPARLTSQTAAQSAVSLVASALAGMYQIAYCATITTASDISSVLGGATGFAVTFTDPQDSVVKTSNPTTPNISAANTTGTTVSGVVNAYCKAGTAITFNFGYTDSHTSTAMAYTLAVYVTYYG